MATTTTDIVNRALIRLDVKTPDNAVDASVMSQVQQSLTDLHGVLYSKGVVSWELTAIPDDSAGLLVDELAWCVRDDFTIPDSKKVSLQEAQRQARADLYTQAETPDNGEPGEISSF